MRQIITTADAPSSPLYSQGVRAGATIFVSGLVGIDPSTNSLAGSTIQEQTRQALKNCQAVLDAGGGTLADVVEVGVLLTHSSDFVGLNEEYAQWFPSEPPTRYVARLGVDIPGVLVSIRMTAIVGEDRATAEAPERWAASNAGLVHTGRSGSPGGSGTEESSQRLDRVGL